MNIQITDSWLREHLKTKATAKIISEKLSLSSVSVEKLEKLSSDFVYNIEVTANRPDLMSVVGIAREAATVLKQAGIAAEFIPFKLKKPEANIPFPLKIESDPKIVNRICAVVLDVSLKESPPYIKERLEASGVRSLNNLIDVTNYVMREVGHPCHVFDFDRLNTDRLIIRESKGGEKITTLDNKEYVLQGGDIVADNGKGEIVDLLAVMGTANSVVTDKTKKILFFIDNNEPYHIRKTSMVYGIRTEAAIINEKGIDPNLAMDALLFGISLYEQTASGRVTSEIFDTFPNKAEQKTIKIRKNKLDLIIGVDVSLKKAEEILTNLDFKVKIEKDCLVVIPPSFRANDITIEEDVIEEVARIIGYDKIPSILPPLGEITPINNEENVFFWEERAKQALKYWGFTEVYSYSFVSEQLLEGPVEDAVTLLNPLSEDASYMRKTLVPSLLEVIKENKKEEIKIFEIANVYEKKKNDLPNEILTLAGVVKKKGVNFYEIKGVVEQLLTDLGIKNINFKPSQKTGLGAAVFVDKDYLGEIEILQIDLINFELNFDKIAKHSTLRKVFKPFNKFPPVFEDLAIIADSAILTSDIINVIKNENALIVDVYLLDQFKDVRTFHITYQSDEKNLTGEDIKEIREKTIAKIEKDFSAKLKN